MLVQVQFGPGAPRAFSIAWRASTENAPRAGVSRRATARLRGERGNQMCLFFFFSCRSKVTPPSQKGDGFQAIKEASSSRGSAGLESSALHAPAQFYLVSKEVDATARAIPVQRQRMMAP